MVISWTSSAELVSRIIRNCKGVDSVFMEDIREWIPEGLRKLNNVYTLETRCCHLHLEHHQAILPCKVEGLAGVKYSGRKLYYYAGGLIKHHPSSIGQTIFGSVVPIYTSSGDLTDVNDGRSKFPRDLLLAMDCPWDSTNWYRMNGRYLESSISSGPIEVWVQDIPRDPEGYPLIPDNEDVQEALYRYVRMMLIEAGYQDPVIRHDVAVGQWRDMSAIAIGAMVFPTPDQAAGILNRKDYDNYFQG